MHPQLLDLLAAHPDCYFQIFTNGQPITEKTAARLRAIGNSTPLISIEGREFVSDERRGKKDVFARTLRGLDHCLKAKLLTGVATSVCRSNIDELLTESWRGERSGAACVCLVSRLLPGGAEAQPRSVVDPRAIGARPPFRGGNARPPSDRDCRCLLRSRRPGALPVSTGISHHISRAVTSSRVRHPVAVEHPRFTRPLRDDAAERVSKDFRELSARHTRVVSLERPDPSRSSGTRRPGHHRAGPRWPNWRP